MRLEAKISDRVRKLLRQPGGNTTLLEAVNRVRHSGSAGPPVTVKVDGRALKVVQVDGDGGHAEADNH